MNTSRIRNSFLVLGVAVGVAACGGSITGTNSGDQLSNAEAQAVLDALSSAFDSVGSSGAMVRLAQPDNGVNTDMVPAVVNFNNTMSFTLPCQTGSMAVTGAVNGSINDQTFEMDMGMDFTWDPNSCVVPSETLTFTLDGAPKIQFQGDMMWGQTQITFSGTETGGFSFTSSDGRSGSCAIDITFSASVNTDTLAETVDVTGTVCGLDAASMAPLG